MSDSDEIMRRARLARHECRELGTLERVYGELERPPEVTIPLRKGQRVPDVGETVVLHDQAGNELEGSVRRVAIIVEPDFETFRNPRLATDQGELL